MITQHFELADGRMVPILCEVVRHRYSAFVLRLDDGDPDDVAGTWSLTWTDGINWWHEEYELPWHALARLAVLVAAVEQDVLLVHDLQDGNRATRAAVVDEVENLIARTVHAFNCRPGCDATDPVNHPAHFTT